MAHIFGLKNACFRKYCFFAKNFLVQKKTTKTTEIKKIKKNKEFTGSCEILCHACEANNKSQPDAVILLSTTYPA